MFWSFSFNLLPDESVIDDSTNRSQSGIKSSYSVFLTNKRAIFRFDGLGSSLTQSFFYNEITGLSISKRFFINYLLLTTKKNEFLLNIPDVHYWIDRIAGIKESVIAKENEKPESATPLNPERKKRELMDMLTNLRKFSILTEKEFNDKVQLLDSIKLN